MSFDDLFDKIIEKVLSMDSYSLEVRITKKDNNDYEVLFYNDFTRLKANFFKSSIFEIHFEYLDKIYITRDDYYHLKIYNDKPELVIDEKEKTIFQDRDQSNMMFIDTFPDNFFEITSGNSPIKVDMEE